MPNIFLVDLGGVIMSLSLSWTEYCQGNFKIIIRFLTFVKEKEVTADEEKVLWIQSILFRIRLCYLLFSELTDPNFYISWNNSNTVLVIQRQGRVVTDKKIGKKFA